MDGDSTRSRLRELLTADLTPGELTEIRALMDEAFAGDEHGGFGDADWDHALGGLHVVLDIEGEIISHAAVVERELHVGGLPLRAGYVEAVATRPGHEGRGHGSTVMERVNALIAATYELGALGTGRHAFYRRLGWETWRGRVFLRTADGPVRTPDEEGDILVLRTPASPPFDLAEDLSCDWRPGDVW